MTWIMCGWPSLVVVIMKDAINTSASTLRDNVFLPALIARVLNLHLILVDLLLESFLVSITLKAS